MRRDWKPVTALAAATVLVLSGLGTSLASASGPTAPGVAATTTAASLASSAARPAVAARKKTGWKPVAGAKFNVPRSGPATQFRLEQQVLGAIRHAKPDSMIRISLFSFDRYPVADALIQAHRRGVDVQVLMNNHEIPGAQKKLRSVIGANRAKRSYIYQCTNGCRSSGENNHDKYFLFSRTGRAKNVVMTGSVNMKMNGAKNQYNDLWTRNNVPEIYRAFDALHDQMERDKVAKPNYWVQNIGKAFQLQALPFHGNGPDHDPIDTILDPVKCLGATGGTGNQGRTRIRVNMHAWDGDRGTYLARRMRKLYALGCDVKLQYGYAGKKVRNELGVRTSRGYVPVRSNGMDTDLDGEIDLYSHMKLLIISGNYGNDSSKRVVVTGSSNYQDSGLRGDELIFRMFDQGKATKQYLANFDWMWNNRTRAVPYQSVSGRGLDGAATSDQRIYDDGLGTDSPEWKDQ
ncbi:hypothetical protein I601_0117 [Nocardioides dokdonensis FR1436]|uniref:phospholipase D n=1 Tax=Nocardioides dokdonensis FR1436 TaxID=1300347 RepID=A0A1A9GGC0_9ACTN|nr:phospholipase D-like domain-containing protein [Nocardioides dokdonensis]ANH36571.1 hypothetical protein I601_0117 [Nocardioides dokdonensis FR1436]